MVAPRRRQGAATASAQALPSRRLQGVGVWSASRTRRDSLQGVCVECMGVECMGVECMSWEGGRGESYGSS
eukprot:41844-Chlamydomonas_euryale.AAC.1